MNEGAKSLRSLRIFLCHSSGDKDFVRRLCRQLYESGFKPWIDEVDLLPGDEWESVISTAVSQSDVVLVCLSRDSITKAGFVQKEIRFALDVADQQPENTIYLIPVKLEECEVPQRLSRWQWVELHKEDGYARLVRALERRAEALGLAPQGKTKPEILRSPSIKLTSIPTAEAHSISSSNKEKLSIEYIEHGKAASNTPPIKLGIARTTTKNLSKTIKQIVAWIWSSSRKRLFIILVGILAVGLLAWRLYTGSKGPQGTTENAAQPVGGITTPLTQKIQRFAPVQITADISSLSENDREALGKIIEAARLLDPLFLRQVWSGNAALEQKLEADLSFEGKERLHYFRINAGPWSRIDDNESFIEGVPALKPPQASYYPDDMTKEEFNEWEKTLSEEERERAMGFFYVIRRDAKGKLKTVPYSEEYREFLVPAAALLREAAGLTTNTTLKDFLSKRADAFLSNDYYESDIAWLALDSPIDVTIGPYETYEDNLFSYKAAFEAYVTLRDDDWAAKVAKIGQYLQEVENNLPVDARYRNPQLGAAPPIRVVNEVFASGEGNSSVHQMALNLPNDMRVIKEKGLKHVALKNVQEAKFNKMLIPISRIMLDPSQLREVTFDSFFTHTLIHDMMHSLGPHYIKVNGHETTVRQQLKETSSAIEEAKADISGLFALQYLMDRGVLDKRMERSVYMTFLVSALRSMRFDFIEAHGRGIVVQFNYLMDEGAITFNYDSTIPFNIDMARVKDAVRKLTHDLMTLQAEGSHEKAKAMLDKYGVLRPGMLKVLNRLSDVPLDIEPIYTSTMPNPFIELYKIKKVVDR